MMALVAPINSFSLKFSKQNCVHVMSFMKRFYYGLSTSNSVPEKGKIVIIDEMLKVFGNWPKQELRKFNKIMADNLKKHINM